MGHSFLAYIDESGDDGVGNFRHAGAHGGTSRWLIISAVVIRSEQNANVVTWRDEISGKMPEKKSREIHFARMNHGQKVVAAQCLSQRPLRAINIACNKTTIPPGLYDQKNTLYSYITRYLIERISWLCRDYRLPNDAGDGTVKITFSRRGGMSYPNFRDYLRRLQALGEQTRIHWPAIDIDGIDARDHSQWAGLQIADAIASAFAAGFEPDRFGNCESRYAETLKPVTYRYRQRFMSYGLKVVPNADEAGLTQDQIKMMNLFREGG